MRERAESRDASNLRVTRNGDERVRRGRGLSPDVPGWRSRWEGHLHSP